MPRQLCLVPRRGLRDPCPQHSLEPWPGLGSNHGRGGLPRQMEFASTHPAPNPRTDTPQRNVKPIDDRCFHPWERMPLPGAREIPCGRQPPLCRSLQPSTRNGPLSHWAALGACAARTCRYNHMRSRIDCGRTRFMTRSDGYRRRGSPHLWPPAMPPHIPPWQQARDIAMRETPAQAPSPLPPPPQ
jgi:hypothetical protein